MEKEKIVIGGHFFNVDLYNYLMIRFKESFSHSSLSVEKAFEILDDCEASLNVILSEESNQYYKMLNKKEKKEIDCYLRRFVVFYGYRCKVLEGSFDVNCLQKQVDSIFYNYFKFFEKYMRFVICFDSNGNFLEKETFHKVGELFCLIYEKNMAYENAYNLQKDHLDAFDYAMSLKQIGIPEIININTIVNRSNPEEQFGFKTSNNMVRGADFIVTDCAYVPYEMQKLMKDYDLNFGIDILDCTSSTIDHEERMRRLLRVFEKEAMFHIRFERIHPFSDGNGRTGRIIMNKHLLDLGMAPVLITGVMTDEYKHYIGTFDSVGLSKMMLASSSQILSNWVSMSKTGINPRKKDVSNESLAKVLTKKDNK